MAMGFGIKIDGKKCDVFANDLQAMLTHHIEENDMQAFEMYEVLKDCMDAVKTKCLQLLFMELVENKEDFLKEVVPKHQQEEVENFIQELEDKLKSFTKINCDECDMKDECTLNTSNLTDNEKFDLCVNNELNLTDTVH